MTLQEEKGTAAMKAAVGEGKGGRGGRGSGIDDMVG